MIRLTILVIWSLFAVYTLHCCRREDFFRSVQAIWALRWGRQVAADLYIGLLLSLLFIFYHGGPGAVLAWAPPVLVLGNLATLLYAVLNVSF